MPAVDVRRSLPARRSRPAPGGAAADAAVGLNPAVVPVLHERGLSADGEHPTLLTHDSVQAADIVVTMGCGETCPVFPGRTYEDWPLDDPKGQDVDTVRRIVDQVDERVQDLLRRLTPAQS